ncbi:MAG: hypothetical protein Q8R92_16915 [Deltaproteobacteria bacterium]|nr:hypothetical protein [Deltaproteobacteria bacterium]
MPRAPNILRGVETRRLYKFERMFMQDNAFRPRPLKDLRAIAANVWSKHGRKGLPCPSVGFTRRVKYSYCVGFSKIRITRRADTHEGLRHDTIDVLLHELVHAMGYGTHGRGFVRKYVDLLVEYAGCEEGELRLGMAMFNIKF